MTPLLIILCLATAVVAYLFGSISSAIIFTKLFSGKDIRELGSGNAGFTNVLRSVGTFPAVLTLLLDFMKGVIAGFVGRFVFSLVDVSGELSKELVIYGGFIGGVFAIIGHMYPIYFKFRGGKGIVTAAALMAVTDWRVFLLSLATFLIVFVFTRIISLSSITAAAMYCVYTFLLSYFFEYKTGVFPLRYVWLTTALTFLLGMFVIIKHKDNIKRLLKGEEKKLTVKK